jgi:multidrug resistance protein, MATE family
MAIVITQNLLPLLLMLYVRVFVGFDCWPGLGRQVFRNWTPMIHLALPSMIMVLAEYTAFGILTVASSRISVAHLAAQTIVMNLVTLFFTLPFPLSIAASTRFATLIGASRPKAAMVVAKTTYAYALLLGVVNLILQTSLRFYIPCLFTKETDVIALVAHLIPLNAAFQLLDAIMAQCSGVLRGLGKQKIGSYLMIISFYVVSREFNYQHRLGT